jgi:TatD DNase family protein
MNPPLVDIGLNLAHDSFDHDRGTWSSAARAAGVRTWSSRAARSRARARDRTRAGGAGCVPRHRRHPSAPRARPHAADIPALRELLLAPEVGAAGECGLDYFRNFSPHEDQERVFRLQLELAVECGKPVFLHQRDGHDASWRSSSDYRPRLPAGVAHCFTGDERELRDYLDLGLSIGITGWICDERRGQHLRELVRR